MKHLIFKTRPQSNMAGEVWHDEYYLEGERGGPYTLTSSIVEVDPIYLGEAHNQPPISQLRNGAEIYEALEQMLSECGYSLESESVSVACCRF